MILIKGGYLINPATEQEDLYDVLIDGSLIKAIDKPGSFEGLEVKKTINAENMWLVPGLIDLHVHLREPGLEDKETIKTGAQAAVKGGFSAVCCMPNTKPANHSVEITEQILQKAKEAGAAKVYPLGAVSQNLQGTKINDLEAMHEAGCVAFTDDGAPIHNASIFKQALDFSAVNQVPIACHEEERSLSLGGAMHEGEISAKLGIPGIPNLSEDLMIARDIEVARASGGHIHICHLSTERSVELIRWAKNEGIKISAEVTPHHLYLTDAAVEEFGTNAKMNPPLRSDTDRQALIEGLKDGTIDVIASDHAPHEASSKACEISKATFGIIGLQSTLPLVLELVDKKVISKMRAIEALSYLPARLFRLPGGELKAGGLADITIIDPNYEYSFKKGMNESKGENSPFWGRAMKGVARVVLVDGGIVCEEMKLVRR